MPVEDLATGVVPDHLPHTRMSFVTKRNEQKICIFMLSFSSQNDLLRDQMCCKLLMPGNMGMCLPLSLCKIPPFPFRGLAYVPCPHRFCHWCAWTQKLQGTGNPVLHYCDRTKTPLHILASGKALNENHGQVMKVPQQETCTSSWKGQHPIFRGKGHIRWAQHAPSLCIQGSQQELSQPCANQPSDGK